jgi:hypothetical protein
MVQTNKNQETLGTAEVFGCCFAFFLLLSHTKHIGIGNKTQLVASHHCLWYSELPFPLF